MRTPPQPAWSAAPGAGFTLGEMMVAIGVFSILLIGGLQLFSMHSRAYHDQQQVRMLQQNLRVALDTMSRDLRMAGYGLPVHDHALAAWLPGWTSNPLIVDGMNGAPDSVATASALGDEVATLQAPAPAGAQTLVLNAGQAALFNTTNRRLLFVGRHELARVLAVSGDTLTISTDPSSGSAGLAHPQAASSLVERIACIRYTIHAATNAFPHQSFLAREEMTASPTQFWPYMVAGHIEDLQVSNGLHTVTIRLRGRSAEPLRARRTSSTNDYAWLTVATEVIPRNSPALCLQDIGNP